METVKVKTDSECIQVIVRCRPFNEKEKRESRIGIVDLDQNTRQVSVKNPNSNEIEKLYTFDAVYDEKTQQKFFYDESCFSLVENVLEGFNATIFAYGQTGCGKSWTMQGIPDQIDLQGVIPNSFSHLFEHIHASSDVEFLVRCSYLEIYNEEIRDLLGDPKSKIKCELHEDPTKGVFIKNLSDVVVENQADLQAMLNKGSATRTVAATLMNDTSSRSHSIFTIVIEMSTKDENGKEHIRAGKLNLVDLAGSERQKKTGASGAQLKEGSKINLSLSALGNVISTLAENKNKHIPYRDSKLTRLLQDSLGGNTKTLMIAAISPTDYNFEETLSTLRYANRAKNITNKPKINEDPKDTLLREYKEEIEKLRKLLEQQGFSDNQQLSGSQIKLQQSDRTDDLETDDTKKAKSKTNSHFQRNNEVGESNTTNDCFENEQEVQGSQNLNTDINYRLQALQRQVMTHNMEASNIQSSKDSNAVIITNSEFEKERQQYNERKIKARKRKELQEAKIQAEMQKIIEERNEEYEELLSAAAIGQSQLEVVENKYSKLKKKYDKKVRYYEDEIKELNEELYEQRQRMQESLNDQDMTLRLYMTICYSLISEKEFNKIVDKSRWDEETREWTIPFVKQKSLESLNSSNGSDRISSGGKKAENSLSSKPSFELPNISQSASLPQLEKHNPHDSGRLIDTNKPLQNFGVELPAINMNKSSHSSKYINREKDDIKLPNPQPVQNNYSDSTNFDHTNSINTKLKKKKKKLHKQHEDLFNGIGNVDKWGFALNGKISDDDDDFTYSDEDFNENIPETIKNDEYLQHSKYSKESKALNKKVKTVELPRI